MGNLPPLARLGAATLLLLLILAACGSPATTAPTAAPTAPALTTAPATLAPAPTTAPTTAPAAAAPPTAAGQNAASPVEFVRKIDTSAQHIAIPTSLAVDRQGNVYVVDAPSARILKYDPQGTFVLEWGSKGSGDGQFEFAPADPNAGPLGGFIAVDAQGNVYVSDAYNSRVQKFDPNGTFLAKWGSQGSGEGQFADGGVGPISIDRQGTVYVSQFGRVMKFDRDGKFLARYLSDGTGDGEFTGAAFGAIDSQGNIYVADLLNARVQKLDPNWKFLMRWGTAGQGDGQFTLPVAIVVDSQDRLYIADNSKRIQVFDPNGKFLGQWSEPGNGDPPFVDGLSGLAMDTQGNIYVANNDGKSIYVFRPREP